MTHTPDIQGAADVRAGVAPPPRRRPWPPSHPRIDDAARWLHGRGSWVLAILFCVAVVGRSYQRLDHPQMWAEDGRNWYAEAHNEGFSTLFTPYAGYLHLLPRLLAWLAAAQRPASAAVAIYVLWVITQLWFAAIIWRRRASIGICPAVLLVGLAGLAPYATEIHGNLTNLQWYGAPVLVVLAVAARTSRLRWDEYATGLLLGLSGPIVGFVAIGEALQFALDRRRRDRTFTALLTLCTCVFIVVLLASDRAPKGMAVSLLDDSMVVGWHVGIGGFLGIDTMIRFVDRIPVAAHRWIGGMVAALLLYSIARGWRGRPERELQAALSSVALLVLLAVFLSPSTSDHPTALSEMMTPRYGSRYWFVPALAVKLEIATLAWQRRTTLLAWLAAIGIAYGMLVDYHIGAYPNDAFMAAAVAYDTAPIGTRVTIPIWPPGWSMEVVKRPAGSARWRERLHRPP